MNQKKLSIVVPIYNVEKYLPRCVDSILSALKDVDSSHYEILLVNDGTPDGSLEISKEFSKKHPNIITIDKKNGGVSDARNFGIERATGQYITFIDSDDYVSNDFGRAFELLGTDDAVDVFQFGYTSVDQDDNVIKSVSHKKDMAVDFTKKKINKQVALVGAVWCKLFKKQIIDDQGLRFTKGLSNGEDLEFTAKFWCHTKKAQLLTINYSMYFCLRVDSNMNTYKFSHFRDHLVPSLTGGYKYADSNNIPKNVEKFVKSFLIAHMYNALTKVVRVTKKEQRKELRVFLRQHKFLLKYPKILSISGKTFWFFTKIFGLKFSIFLLSKIYR